jgi:hypothetical protein|tara:strand:+ start:408 stop:1490 length:1083 start_codon:yes stop_codon:yes gene_type:complete
VSKLQKIPIFGALSGLIKEELVEPTIDRFLRSVRGYGALGDLPTPTKGVLDPAEMGKTKLPTFVEDIPFKRTESGLSVPEKKIKIEDLEGRVLTPAYGDRTKADATLTKVDDIELTTPVKLEGGHGYMREGEGLWASEYPAMKSKARAMEKMDDPLMVYTAMAGQAGDFSKMMSDTTLDIIKKSNISKKSAKEYDNRIKKEVDKNWPGILSENIDEYVDNMAGTKRRELWQRMDAKQYRDLGFPNLGVIRTAISDAELLTVPSFATGRSIGQPTSLEVRPSTHRTYDTEIPGEYIGSLDSDVPGQLIFRDFFTKMAQRLKDTGVSNPQRGFLMTPSISQKVDQQMIDEVSEFQELMQGAR